MPPDEENMPEEVPDTDEDVITRLRAAMASVSFGSPQYWGVDLPAHPPVTPSDELRSEYVDALAGANTGGIAVTPDTPRCSNCGLVLADKYYNDWGYAQEAHPPFGVLDGILYQNANPVPRGTKLCVSCAINCRSCGRWTVQEYQNGPAYRRAYDERWIGAEFDEYSREDDGVLQRVNKSDACLWCGDQCEACRNMFPSDEVHFVPAVSYYDEDDNEDSDDGWYLCDNCTNVCVNGHRYRLGYRCRLCNNTRSHHRIRSYGYKPEPQFFGSHPGVHKDLFFGIEHELELQHGENMDRVIEKLDAIDSAKVLYSKHDGSLDNGIEIVSHPMTLEFWRDEYPWDLWTPRDGLGAHLKSSPHTGIHVHLSKAAFTKGHAYRFAAFHFQNPNFIENVAGRVSNTYTEMRPDFRAGYVDYHAPDRYKIDAPHYSREPMLSHANLQAKGKIQNGSRYWAINAQNPETFELRYFRSTVSRKRLHFYRQWLDAVFAYTQSGWIRTRRPERQLTPYNMRNWLEAQNAGARFDLVLDFMNRDFYATTLQS